MQFFSINYDSLYTNKIKSLLIAVFYRKNILPLLQDRFFQLTFMVKNIDIKCDT